MTTHPAGASQCPVLQAPVIAFTPWRWAVALLGVLAVAVGAVGVVVPGLPTTIFLIIASWCFAKSCPWLETRLIRNRFFRPFLVFMEPGARMPLRAKVISNAMMWIAISGSCGMFFARGDFLITLPVIAAGAIGSWFIAKR
ncbi:MAG: DUF454 family protein [Phycisphaerales bacterium JB058]